MIEPIITQPEDLAPEQISTIPNPATERTATALLPLLREVADALGVPVNLLVHLRAEQVEHGSVGLFGVLPFQGAMAYESVAVAVYDAREEIPLVAVRHASVNSAENGYDAARKRLA